MLQRRHRTERQQGQAIVLFALMLVVILGFAAVVVDLGVLRNNRQILQNTMDAAALAGGTDLPVQGATAETALITLINTTVQADFPGLPLPTVANGGIQFKCLIGANASGQADLNQITAGVCNPSGTLGRAPLVTDFTGAGSTRTSICDPSKQYNSVYDKCNVVIVTANETTKYGFAPVLGVGSGNTGAIQSAACNGPCGSSVNVPTDLVVIMDRTASMSDADVANTVTAAEAILTVYQPLYQRVALGLIGPSTSPACTGVISGVNVTAVQLSSGQPNPDTVNTTDVNEWIPVGLSGTDSGSPAPTYKEAYSTAGVLASTSSSHLVAALSCYKHPGGAGTDLGTPLLMAKSVLDADTRSGVTKGIILETDGQPDNASSATPATDFTCWQANQDATTVKNDGITLYTVGFGLDTSDPTCPDANGTKDSAGNTFYNKKATQLLASMASQPSTSVDKSTGKEGCYPADNPPAYPGYNNDYYCEPKTATLSAVFENAAINLLHGGLQLLQPYPAPIVSSLSPTTGTHLGGTSVTITGLDFTGATSVTFGGAAATNVTVVSDTSITATSPAGSGTVNVQVTTPGGASPIVTADQYTYT